MIRYEYPFNESIRTLLRLEQLFDRLGQLLPRELPVDHHFALLTLFELVEIASRSDLKPDLLRELERQKTVFNSYRGNPQISEQALDGMVARIDGVIEGVTSLTGKSLLAAGGPDWLTSLRSRIGIPAGTCSFDLPSYHVWQHRPAAQRQADLAAWTMPLAPLAEALRLILQVLRDSGVPHRVVAEHGVFQQSLPPGRSFQLLRMRIDPALGLVPEITAHRLMVSIRLMQQENQERLKPANETASFELTLCA